MKSRYLFVILIIIFVVAIPSITYAESSLDLSDFGINFNSSGEDPQAVVDTVKLFILFTILTLAPSFLILTTSFTRIVIVLSFVRNALGTQQTPPNQVLIGLAIFLTFFIMQPVYSEVMDDAVTPFVNNEINQEQAFDIAAKPIKEFMLEQTREKDLAIFMKASNTSNTNNAMEIPLTVVVPAFAISELKTAFSIGFMLYIPFLVIDLIVASILMSMGMFMLPPVMISLPFKILLFILVDGWYLVIDSILKSFT